MLDLLIQNALVVDPETGFASVADVALEDGLIAEVASGIEKAAKQAIDARGLVLQPGIIDSHLHLAPNALGHRMAALAGVTTCIDMAGPAGRVMADMVQSGCGLNVAVLNAILPGKNVSGTDPSAGDIAAFVERSVSEGNFGVKLLGGHFPLTPEASARMVACSAERGVYMAWHAGTLARGSDIEGMTEAVGLAQGRPFHLAHINAYCRGRVMNELLECERAAGLLKAHPEIITESYLSARNGAPLGSDGEGVPKSKIVLAQLRHFGFEPTRKGICDAMRAGVLSAIEPENGILALKTGEEGVEAYLSGRAADGSFDRVNPAVSRVFFASARRPDGTFLVDAIGTDGGAIPRNVIVEAGVSLVRLCALTWIEFAAKTSLLPARMLGLARKGRVRPGFDADLTLFDPVQGKALWSFVKGRPVLEKGAVAGRKGTILCTPAGEKAVLAAGLSAEVLPGGVPRLDRTFGRKTA